MRDLSSTLFNGFMIGYGNHLNRIRSSRALSLSEAVQSYHVLTHASSEQLFVALVLIKNMETVDVLTFEDLNLHLKSQGCHLAKLSPMDFSAKNSVEGCLRGS